MEGWIKIHRKIKDWEWYTDSNMVHLFLHLLLEANSKDGKWKGIDVKRGQLITGRKSLSEDTGISVQSIRTCLERFRVTKELTIRSTNKYSIITICNYEDYQLTEEDRQPADQPADQPATNHKQEYSIESIDNFTTYYNRLLSFFPSKFRPKNKSQQNAWIETLDKLVRIDGLTTDEIEEMVKWARSDEFWSKNFMTPIKLRKKNSEQIPYWTVFQAKMETSSEGSSTVDRYRKIANQEERR